MISAWFYFLLSAVNAYVALILGSRAMDAFRQPVELGGKLYPQTVGVIMYVVAALVLVLLSAHCAKAGTVRMDRELEADESATQDDWL